MYFNINHDLERGKTRIDILINPSLIPVCLCELKAKRNILYCHKAIFYQ